jgi:putative tricarboxylic transport membrane protein
VLGMFFGRPISIAIFAAALLTLLYPLLARRRKPAVALATPVASPDAGPDRASEEEPAKAPGLLQRPRDLPGMVIALAMIALAVWAIWQTAGMTALGSVFPRTICVALVAFSVILVAINLLRRPGTRQIRDSGSPARRIGIVVAMALWVVAIPWLGFATAALGAFLLLIALATYERMPLRTIVIHAVSAVLIVACFYLLMAELLLIRLPAGLFI